MTCDLTSGRLRQECSTGRAGIKTLYFTKYNDFAALTGITESGGEITSLGAVAINLFQFEMESNVGNFEEVTTGSRENGTAYMTQTVTMTLFYVKPADLATLNNLKKGRWAVWSLDFQDKIRLLGRTRGMVATGGSDVSGAAHGDKKGLDLTLEAVSNDFAPFMADYTTTPFDNFTNVTVIAEDVVVPSILEDGNTVAWFDMDESYMTKDGANLVSQWADRSGEDNHLLQAGADSIKPVWSSTGVLFDGVDDFLKCATFTIVQPEHIYIVLRQKTWTTNDAIFDGDGINQGKLMQKNGTPSMRIYAGAEIPADNTQIITLDTFGIVKVLFNGASSYIQADEITRSTGDAGAVDLDGFTLASTGAGSAFSHIEVKEVIIRNVADSDPNALIISNYLKSKYYL